MRIVSFDPYLTDLVGALGLASELVGISGDCVPPNGVVSEPLRVTEAGGRTVTRPFCSLGASAPQGLSGRPVIDDNLRATQPDLILTRLFVDREDLPDCCTRFEQELATFFGQSVELCACAPDTLESVYDNIELVGRFCGKHTHARDIAQRMKAQFMDWCANFYDRTKNKRVSFISGVNPWRLGGNWIPEMIKLASARPQVWQAGAVESIVEWVEVQAFNPDVLVFAPWGESLSWAGKFLNTLTALPGWDKLPAVKRGDVYFVDGERSFYQPSQALIESMAVLISALAGFESGYIAPRDSFYKLRWLELHRHRLAVGSSKS